MTSEENGEASMVAEKNIPQSQCAHGFVFQAKPGKTAPHIDVQIIEPASV